MYQMLKNLTTLINCKYLDNTSKYETYFLIMKLFYVINWYMNWFDHYEKLYSIITIQNKHVIKGWPVGTNEN